MSDAKHLYWGDIHNHNEIGYAKGSLERSYDIAKRGLDYFAFTAHSRWHDLPKMPQDKHLKWVKGFELVRKQWPRVEKMAAENYRPGRFVTFVAYEWHSSRFGDYCLIYPDGGETPLKTFDDVKDLQAYARQAGALIIPHHPAYLAGWRGAAFEHLDTGVSPVVEFYSEHGGARSDRGPFPYLRHSMGGRWTPNTMRSLLASGARVGVVASTDDHLGYPGAYQEGLTGLYADALTREGIFEALRARRTFAVTGDRIALDFRLSGHRMGEAIPATDRREIEVTATGWDEIDRIELARNNRVIARVFPTDEPVGDGCWDEPVLCRVEFGWGPWGDLNMARVCDWDFEVALDGGQIVDVLGCFRSGPFDENRRNIITRRSDARWHVRSYTSRIQPLGDLVTNAVVLKLSAKPDAKLSLSVNLPGGMKRTMRLSDLGRSSDVAFTGPFSSESILCHRLVLAPRYRGTLSFRDRATGKSTDWYDVRVVQANGDEAWSSPIWVEG
ncbi:MAG: DUF3604 domain-containing protein [Phycisphaerae bacterium]|nr:DUF3604 domain-containing protein [Phycisphaerae bacterium]